MKNLKVAARLRLIFGVIVILFALTSAYSVNEMSNLSTTTKNLYDHPFTVSVSILTADGNIIRMHRAMKDIALATNSQDIDNSVAALDLLEKNVYEQLALAKDKYLGDKSDIDRVTRSFQEWKPIRDKTIAFKREGKNEEASAITKTLGADKIAEISKAIRTIKESAKGKASSFYVNAAQSSSDAIKLVIVINALILLAIITVGYFLAISITRPLAEAVGVAQRVATGDLTAHIQSTAKDEIGILMRALKEMNDNLLKIVGQVKIGTDTIATASGQIAVGNQDLSSRTEQQAGSLEETAASMEELTSTVKQNADNARQANELAVSASEVAIKGGTVVSQVVETMGAINDSSKKIVDIISVIDGIAFQTNILALNAAVEAARAGEQGRGFAVVASEVRSLAQRSAAAAKEIKTLIGDSVEKVDVGAKLVDNAGETMQEIVASITRVTDIMNEITAATQEQTSGIEQINQAISQMDQVTQQNAALVEEAAAASEAMQDQASKLAQVVSVFKLDGRQPAAVVPVARVRSQSQAGIKPPVQKAALNGGRAIAVAQPKHIANTPLITGDEWEQF
jgi:methyl-accepting chemotaxis protein